MKVITKSLWLVALTFSTNFTFGQIFPQQSGGANPATNILSAVPHAGLLRIDYDFFAIPDTLDVYYENINIFSSGWVQGSGQFNIPYGPGNSTNLIIVINKDGNPIQLTNWQYTPSVVQPVRLTIGVTQNRQVTLTWPYPADTFTLESCSDLNAPQWQPVTNMSITLSNGIYCATGPITATNQFFRLRPN
jgi:hypothetical protein